MKNSRVADLKHAIFEQETRSLLHQRVRVCIWLGIILYPLFSALDYLVAPDYFMVFFRYRIIFSLSCMALLFFHSLEIFRKHSFLVVLIWFTMASLAISMMIVHLGGFGSYYYVGIILVMMVCSMVLPLDAGQAAFSSLILYAAYVFPVYFLTEPQTHNFRMFLNNSFFFASFIAVSVIQCHQETKARKREFDLKMRLDSDLVASYKDFQNARVATILGLAKLAEYRDTDTGNHLERIREYTRVIATELAKISKYKSYITAEYIDDLYLSAVLHDIGKVGIPDAILLKPGRLSDEEFEIIKLHTIYGGDILRMVEARVEGQSFVTLGREIAYYHHEKWNGTGYPKGLKGEDIPLSTRIVCLADVYDALTSKRSYKSAFSHEETKNIILRGKGTHFDPEVVEAFERGENEFEMIRARMPALGN
ncbi:MAG: HD domain-containing protein [Desulfobacter sp.]|nr:MAG: HD domain-containing protein [Desulfobacter sp.]